MYDLNDAPPLQGIIPEGEYILKTKVIEGGFGENYMLTRAKSGPLYLIVLMCTVMGGEFNGRQFKAWVNFEYLENEPDPQKADNYRQAVKIGRGMARAMIESARGIDPKDKSETAIVGRQFESLTVFNGLMFKAHVIVKAGQNGYRESNTIYTIIHDPGNPVMPPQTPAQAQAKAQADGDSAGGSGKAQERLRR